VTFLWPAAFGLYPVVAVLAAAYIWRSRRSARQYVRFSSLGLVAQAAAAGGPQWHRHVPAGLYLGAISTVILSVARPVASVPYPDDQTSVMLCIDVSGSMDMRDIEPTRLGAAKRAAKQFIQALPPRAKVGLVSFSDRATLVAVPTTHHAALAGAIDRLATQSATAIGDGILAAVYALPGRERAPGGGRSAAPSAGQAPADPDQLPPAAVVLLTDGENNTGTSPADAALVARRLRVKVYTVGIGTTAAATEPLDEQGLRDIAATTGGAYYRATSAPELVRVYRTLGRAVAWPWRPTEVSGPASLAAAVLLLVALLSSHRKDRIF